MKVLIIDYGMGNVGSVKRALEECGAGEVVISHYPSDFDDCTHAVLPGVGAFPDAMANLRSKGLVEKIRHLALEDKVPLLGICLGMQLLATKGTEVREEEGLELIPGSVVPLVPISGERVPHVGWNELKIERPDDPMMHGIRNMSDFYFVHSFHFQPADPAYSLTTTPYCGNFVSMVRSGNIIGTQFHPEKSSSTGFQLLRNFLTI
ncbi:MAG TPA: imidazole glycerol phosphate synthase subunit HisH [Chitinophagaceae bacterium]|jgi:glutamine amidotransferase|nr:imidazole glycerol phosphate synthase subunit HisH [Chitinophagaceae bacterium]